MRCGEGFNDAVANNPWCREYGILTGGDYLKTWAASMYRQPHQLLPGVGLVSHELQNCGKSSLPGSFGMLMTRGGYCNSMAPLATDFNSPLLGCVLYDLDDFDLSHRGDEYYRKLQPWMTSDTLPVVGKGTNAMTVQNNLHFIHTADNDKCFAIRDGDTRWIFADVKPLEQEIPKPELTRRLVKEAPYFLKALFDLQLPKESDNRLYLPILDTAAKRRLIAQRGYQSLSDDQAKWLSKVRELAADGKLASHTTFDRLKELMGDVAPPNSRAFQGA